MTGQQVDAACKMADSVRWYEWTGRTLDGQKIRALSRNMIKSPFNIYTVPLQNVAPYRKGAV